MKQWNNVKGGNQDQRWQDNVMMLERTLYEQAPLLVRIVGGVYAAGQHWCKSKNNKNFPLYCPTFNSHTEEHDLMFCPECWVQFETGQGPRVYHSEAFNVYGPDGVLLEDPAQWTPRSTEDQKMCPFHNTPLKKLSCGICDLHQEGYDGRVGPASRRFIFNLLIRNFQAQGQENPLRVIEVAAKTMEQINQLQMFNQNVHPADPNTGCDFYLHYDKHSRNWTTQMAEANKPLTAEEQQLPLWDVDRHFRAAEASQIAGAITTHNLKQRKTAEQIAATNAWRAQNNLPPLDMPAQPGVAPAPAPAMNMAAPQTQPQTQMMNMAAAPVPTAPSTPTAPAPMAPAPMTTAAPAPSTTTPPTTSMMTPAAAPTPAAPVEAPPQAMPAMPGVVTPAEPAPTPSATPTMPGTPSTVAADATTVAPTSEATPQTGDGTETPMLECFGQWGSNAECMRCDLRMGCIEKFQNGSA